MVCRAMKRPKLEDAVALCTAVGVAVYLNTLDCGFCFDDEQAIIKNGDLRPETPWSNLLFNDFWGTSMESRNSHKSYRPLCVATFRLNYLLHELQPMGYHLVNVLLHGAVCYLYVQLCGVVFSQVWPALIAGLLFAVHPIHTEAVAGVVGRADVLSAFFFLASILSHHKSVSCRERLGYHFWLAMALVLCCCSALCKELGITAAALCLAWDVIIVQSWSFSTFTSVRWQLSNNLGWRSFMMRGFIITLFVAIFLMFRLSIMMHQPLFSIALNPAAGQPSPYRQLHWAYLCFYNLWLLLCPSHLSPDYSMGTIPPITSIFDSKNVLTVMTFLSLGYLILILCKHRKDEKRKRIPLFSLVLMVVTFLPASNLFFPVGFVVAERVLYLPSMGFCMLVAYGMWHVFTTLNSGHLKTAASVAVALLLILLSLRTLERNRVWISEEILYREAVRTHPNNAKMLHNLATRVADTDLEMAEKLLRMSAQVESKYVSSFTALGFVLSQQNKPQEAEETYWKAVELIYEGMKGDNEVTSSVKNLKTFTRLAKLLKQNSSRLNEAYQLCANITRHLKERGIHYPKIYAEMGDILVRLNDHSSARVAVNTALSQDPRCAVAITVLAKLEAEQGNVTAAELVLRTGLERVGLKLPLVIELADHLIKHHHDNMKSMKEAEHLLLQVTAADSANTEALFSLGQLYSASVLSQPSKAIELFSKVIRQVPTHQRAMLSLARLCSEENRCKEAKDLLESLLQNEPVHRDKVMKLLKSC